MDAAQTRLRRTFAYPTDSDDLPDAGRDDLDEQQQEQLITSLQQSSSSTDLIYTRIFTVLPLLTILPFLWHLSQRGVMVPSFLSVLSLLLTAWIMGRVSPDVTAARRRAGADEGEGEAWWIPFRWPRDKSSPEYISQVLPWVNLGLSLVLGLGSWLTFRFHAGEAGFGNFGLLLLVPGILFGVVSVVRQGMADVKRGVGELTGLRYGLKGA